MAPIYNILSIASARTTPRDQVNIKILDLIENGEVSKRYWCLGSDVFVEDALFGLRSPQLVFVEPNIPHVVRQLYGVMVARGSTFTLDCSIDQFYQLRGPMLDRANTNILSCRCEHESCFLPKNGMFAEQLADWTRFEWIFKMLWLPHNRPLALAVTLGARWRRLAASGMSRRRVLERTQMIKQELMAAAWHPRRMVDWCLDTDDQEELRAL